MSTLIYRLSSITSLACLIFAVPPASANPPPDTAPPRVRPLSEHNVVVASWETVSSSPFGDSRWGGSDERRFAFSPDGVLLVSEDAGGWQLEFWEVASGKSLGRFGRIADPTSIAFSPDGKTLLAAGHGPNILSVELWDVASRKVLRNLDEDVNDVPFTAVDFSPDGKTLALGGGIGRRTKAPAIHFWDVATGDEVRQFGGIPLPDDPRRALQAVIEAMSYSPDGRSLAFVDDGKVLLWELATGKERCVLGVLPLTARRGNGDPGASLAFSPDGQTLAVGTADGAVRQWDVIGGAERPPFVGHKGGVRAVRFAPDGKTLWSFGRDNIVRTWPTSGPFQEWRAASAEPSDKALTGWWEDLLSDDPLVQYGAVQNLGASPARTASFLRDRVKPVPMFDAQRAAQLVADLKKPDFNDRKKAIIELRKLGELAVIALRRGNVGGGYDEVTRRILQKMESQYPTPEQLRACRALDALERMGGDDAKQLMSDLSKGAPEALLSRQAKAALEHLSKAPAPPVENIAPRTLWDDLASDDAARAYRVVRALAVRPEKSLPFLRDQLQTLAGEETGDDPKRVAKLIADLGADDFDRREGASRELGGLGRRVEPALLQALQAKPDTETTRRLEELMKAKKPEFSPKQMQGDRALEALELIGGVKARHALESLDKDARNHWLKERIDDSLRRLHE